MDFSKFDKKIDLSNLKSDIVAASEHNVGDYKEVPHGQYEVKVEKLELKESKSGKPMVSAWFRIVAGDFENSVLFMNQVVEQGFQIHIVNEFLRSLESKEVQFESYTQYAQLLDDILDDIEGAEFAVEYGENRGFSTFKITEIFE